MFRHNCACSFFTCCTNAWLRQLIKAICSKLTKYNSLIQCLFFSQIFGYLSEIGGFSRLACLSVSREKKMVISDNFRVEHTLKQ